MRLVFEPARVEIGTHLIGTHLFEFDSLPKYFLIVTGFWITELDNGESASTDAKDVLNERNTISHSAALRSVETLLDYMGQRGFDYGDITDVRHICVDIRKEKNKQQKQRRIADFF
ncbi:hypothetical protein AVEN_157323-1 [Araneus ventricosus]|uniref:Uncharacterized protein n=1 Tax=Araneus ventricosus TaxID=182803 RepID=A0A4Y2NRK2_ARAVE|nr:hypothetical protein AVEN_157323-1 [Araneus ventricosus]